ncbi:SURF1 family protein [Loktanella sp. D2R18]|uniref:SURF1 family protein n=1 Tax=Rhodobacterales TaxID=204455 RepID=UPI000DE8BBB5|nr:MULTISPECIES: SURF1 family protein [Rhodobacterales]MDO6590123.1 SURF1 family protein [Yoonia sp. 1_MG-2023]RBW45761.1 SURF1 family protein [Loktanella sp. D2R18]
MLRKLIFPLLLGIAGCGVLVSLGVWQVQRLSWKENILAELDSRLTGAPTPLTQTATEIDDEYTRVTLAGAPTGEELHVLTSGTAAGTGYRVISKFILDDGSAILVDLGLLPLVAKDAAPLIAPMQITGTLLWPDDQNNSTPDPDLAKNIWFARNTEIMAAELATEPFMIVASTATPADPRLTPLPVATSGIKNDHLEYAITWFSLAFVWAVMTLFLIFRTTRQKDV